LLWSCQCAFVAACALQRSDLRGTDAPLGDPPYAVIAAEPY
jgi:hypothetical protein